MISLSKLKVLVFEVNLQSARSFYRSKGVFSYFDRDFEFDYYKRGEHFDRFDMMEYDAIFIGGLYDDQAVTMVKWAKDQGKLVICDYDDDLFCVTPENKLSHVFNNPRHINTVRYILENSDLCFVTVEGLKKKFSQYAKNVVVIPNCINDYIIDLDKSVHHKNKVVLWRGGDSHNYELDIVTPQFIQLMRKYPDWKFIFKGYNPHKLTSAVTNALFSPAMDLFDYFPYLQNCRASITFIPLRNVIFNDSKSNIGWHDATLAGSTAVVPTYGGQWHGEPYATSYSKIEDAVDKLEVTMQNYEDDSMFQNSRRLLKKSYLLSDWNKVRKQEISKIL